MNWSLKKDVVKVTVSPQDQQLLLVVSCESWLQANGARDLATSRFTCWMMHAEQGAHYTFEGGWASGLVDMSGRAIRALLCFALPVTMEEAQRLCGACDRCTWEAVRPARWAKRVAAALDQGWVRLPNGLSFEDEVTTSKPVILRHRLYANEDYILAALPASLGSGPAGQAPALQKKTREWMLLHRPTWVATRMVPALPATPGRPPASLVCEPGPDSRLPAVLALLNETPERLELNELSRPHATITGACDMPSIETGVAFTIGNMAAPGKKSAKAAASVLRRAIFGPRFGVRASASEPLAGREVSVACLNSATNSDAAILDNEARRSRLTARKKKEVTAHCNKQVTLNEHKCRMKNTGQIQGPATIDYLCRRSVQMAGGQRYCMGVISQQSRRCRQCGADYADESGKRLDARLLLGRKTILEPIEALVVAKKLRACPIAASSHFLLRGSTVITLRQAMEAETDAENAVETVLPLGYELSSDKEASLSYAAPGRVLYILNKNALEAHGADLKKLENEPALDASSSRPRRTKKGLGVVKIFLGGKSGGRRGGGGVYGLLTHARALKKQSRVLIALSLSPPCQVDAPCWVLHSGPQDRRRALSAIDHSR